MFSYPKAAVERAEKVQEVILRAMVKKKCRILCQEKKEPPSGSFFVLRSAPRVRSSWRSLLTSVSSLPMHSRRRIPRAFSIATSSLLLSFSRIGTKQKSLTSDWRGRCT